MKTSILSKSKYYFQVAIINTILVASSAYGFSGAGATEEQMNTIQEDLKPSTKEVLSGQIDKKVLEKKPLRIVIKSTLADVSNIQVEKFGWLQLLSNIARMPKSSIEFPNMQQASIRIDEAINSPEVFDQLLETYKQIVLSEYIATTQNLLNSAMKDQIRKTAEEQANFIEASFNKQSLILLGLNRGELVRIFEKIILNGFVTNALHTLSTSSTPMYLSDTATKAKTLINSQREPDAYKFSYFSVEAEKESDLKDFQGINITNSLRNAIDSETVKLLNDKDITTTTKFSSQLSEGFLEALKVSDFESNKTSILRTSDNTYLVFSLISFTKGKALTFDQALKIIESEQSEQQFRDAFNYANKALQVNNAVIVTIK
ncbi:MAG: hypothetical protein KAH32_04985 [Chlamydiia bacterium]|nr:hypothetical protein [Chlamydiia bacterium]